MTKNKDMKFSESGNSEKLGSVGNCIKKIAKESNVRRELREGSSELGTEFTLRDILGVDNSEIPAMEDRGAAMEVSDMEAKAKRCIKIVRAMAPVEASELQIADRAFELMDKTEDELGELEAKYGV